MENTKLQNAVDRGNVIVVAGAGISKDSPSDLPSWWEYNISLLDEIGKFGGEALEQTNLLNMDMIQQMVPVISISEFFVDRIASYSYYPLLTLLDGANPNMNHLLLARKAKEKAISGIVTTNFDTLLEQAFEQENVDYKVYDEDEDFSEIIPGIFPIYKVHGSSANPTKAIDTVHQKLRGLSMEKRSILKKLFSENHILFMGFSGEDFLFGTEYLPVQENKNNGYGITWIAYPGGKFNNNTKKIIEDCEAEVLEVKLPDFYRRMGWEIPEPVIRKETYKEPFSRRAGTMIRRLLEKPYIGQWACAGLCLDLMMCTGDWENAEKVYCLIKKKLQQMNQFIIEPCQISLHSELIKYALLKGLKADALEFNNAQLISMKHQAENMSKMMMSDNQQLFRMRMLNQSTIWNHRGQMLLQFFENAEEEAYQCFNRVFYMAYIARHWENMAVSLANMGMLMFHKLDISKGYLTQEELRCIAVLNAAKRIAKRGGSAQILFRINYILAEIHIWVGQIISARKYLNEAELFLPMCIEQEANRKCIGDLKKMLKEAGEGNPPWEIEAHLCEFCDEEKIWYPYGQRPILKYEEGRNAKLLFESGKTSESIKLMKDTATKSENEGNLLMAEAFYDCLCGIFMNYSNEFLALGRGMFVAVTMKKAEEYYEKCMDIAIKISEFGHLAQSLGTVAYLKSWRMEEESLDMAMFQAELCLCLVEKPEECWQTVQAVFALCNITHYRNNMTLAREYGSMYLDMVEKVPWAASDSNKKTVHKIVYGE